MYELGMMLTDTSHRWENKVDIIKSQKEMIIIFFNNSKRKIKYSKYKLYKNG